MSRRFLSLLMLVVVALQSVLAVAAPVAAKDAQTDMQQHCAGHDGANPLTDSTSNDMPDCCDEGCASQSACTVSCVVYSMPSLGPLLFPFSSNDEPFALVTRGFIGRDYPPLNPPPNA